MNFGLGEEQELLQTTARDFLGAHASSRQVREVLDGPEPYSAPLWREVAKLGWTGLAVAERWGGSGLGVVEQCVVVEQLGRCLAPIPFLPTALAAAAVGELGDAAQQGEWLPRIASGDAVATLALAEAAGDPDPEHLELRAAARGDGWRLDGEKCFVPDAASADLLVVVARTPAAPGAEPGLALFLVPRETPGVGVEATRSMDALRPLHRVELRGVDLPGAALLGGLRDARDALRRVLDRGLCLVAAEMLGGSQRCLDDAVAHAKTRVQFGKPIGVHQAIKHKCADMLFQVESARSLVYYAAWAADAGDGEASLLAAMAKAGAGDAYCRCAAENLQIHGGVGFTWEYDCHLFLKRARSDESWLGDARHHRERVAGLLEL